MSKTPDRALRQQGHAGCHPAWRFGYSLRAVREDLRVRLRMDGVLKEMPSPVQLAQKLSARLKVMSRLDIAERRVPQDGRIKMKLSKNRAIDFRVSSCPTLFGEKIVLRILDPAQATLGIDSLGYEPFQKELYLKYLAKPQA